MAGDSGITVDLQGEALDPRAVADAITEVESLVQSLRADGSALLTLTELRAASAHISMSVRGAPLETLHEGLEELRQAPALPSGWQRESLQAVANLRKVAARRGVEGITLQIGDTITAIDGVIQQNAEQALAPSSRSLGSVRGTLYRYTNDVAKNRRSAGLRNAHTGDTIELRFSHDTAPRIREYLESEVEVWGQIARDTTGKLLQLNVEGIEPIPASESVRAEDGRGLLGADWTDGMDPAEWVRAQRG